MSRTKRFIIIVLTIVVALFLIATWYQYTYSMDEVAAFEINATEQNDKLLIATQGSAFKDSITKNIINYYKNDPLYIKVMDIGSLHKVAPENYKAIVLIHTWENWKPPIEVKKFIERTNLHQNKIVVLTTSGAGTSKMDAIDAITGESKLEDVQIHINKIIQKLNPLLKQ